MSLLRMAADAPEKMRHWYSKNLTGLRIYSGGSNIKMDTRLDDPRAFPAWECAQELGISVCVSLFPARLEEMLVMIKRYPKVRIVIDGLFKAPIDEGPPYNGCGYLFDLARYDNVYVKLSTNNVRASRRGNATPESFFPRLVAALGASHIAWCSNFPASKGRLADMLAEAKSALAMLSPADQKWIFYRTAQTLYPALADA
jgi:L-fuconolactonase